MKIDLREWTLQNVTNTPNHHVACGETHLSPLWTHIIISNSMPAYKRTSGGWSSVQKSKLQDLICDNIVNYRNRSPEYLFQVNQMHFPDFISEGARGKHAANLIKYDKEMTLRGAWRKYNHHETCSEHGIWLNTYCFLFLGILSFLKSHRQRQRQGQLQHQLPQVLQETLLLKKLKWFYRWRLNVLMMWRCSKNWWGDSCLSLDDSPSTTSANATIVFQVWQSGFMMAIAGSSMTSRSQVCSRTTSACHFQGTRTHSTSQHASTPPSSTPRIGPSRSLTQTTGIHWPLSPASIRLSMSSRMTLVLTSTICGQKELSINSLSCATLYLMLELCGNSATLLYSLTGMSARTSTPMTHSTSRFPSCALSSWARKHSAWAQWRPRTSSSNPRQHTT